MPDESEGFADDEPGLFPELDQAHREAAAARPLVMPPDEYALVQELWARIEEARAAAGVDSVDDLVLVGRKDLQKVLDGMGCRFYRPASPKGVAEDRLRKAAGL